MIRWKGELRYTSMDVKSKRLQILLLLFLVIETKTHFFNSDTNHKRHIDYMTSCDSLLNLSTTTFSTFDKSRSNLTKLIF